MEIKNIFKNLIVKGSILSLVSIGLLLSNSLSSNNSFSSSNNFPDSSTSLDTQDMSGEMDSVDTYSSGMAGYGATPFKMSGFGNSAIETWYINTDGYLYGAGYNGYGGFGIGTTLDKSSFVKVGTSTSGGLTTGGFYKPIDFDVSQQAGIVVDSSGKVWTSGRNTNMTLGLGSSYTDSQYNYFRTVATSGTSGATYLPSNYKAVAVAAGGYGYTNMILTSTGALYGAGYSSHLGGASTSTGYFVRLDTGTTSSGLPQASSSNPIIDIGGGNSASYVLYKDGSLYKGTSSWTKVNPSGVSFKMMDTDANGQYCYAVSSDNKIYYASSFASSMTAFSFTPTGTVTQVRGASDSGWGYLNSAGALYIATSNTGTPSTSSSYNSGVTYFDIGGNGSSNTAYGIIQNSVTKLWGFSGHGGLGNGTTGTVYVSSPFTPSNVDTSYDGQGPHDISNSPPAITDFSNEK